MERSEMMSENLHELINKEEYQHNKILRLIQYEKEKQKALQTQKDKMEGEIRDTLTHNALLTREISEIQRQVSATQSFIITLRCSNKLSQQLVKDTHRKLAHLEEAGLKRIAQYENMMQRYRETWADHQKVYCSFSGVPQLMLLEDEVKTLEKSIEECKEKLKAMNDFNTKEISDLVVEITEKVVTMLGEDEVQEDQTMETVVEETDRMELEEEQGVNIEEESEEKQAISALNTTFNVTDAMSHDTDAMSHDTDVMSRDTDVMSHDTEHSPYFDTVITVGENKQNRNSQDKTMKLKPPAQQLPSHTSTLRYQGNPTLRYHGNSTPKITLVNSALPSFSPFDEVSPIVPAPKQSPPQQPITAPNIPASSTTTIKHGPTASHVTPSQPITGQQPNTSRQAPSRLKLPFTICAPKAQLTSPLVTKARSQPITAQYPGHVTVGSAGTPARREIPKLTPLTPKLSVPKPPTSRISTPKRSMIPKPVTMPTTPKPVAMPTTPKPATIPTPTLRLAHNSTKPALRSPATPAVPPSHNLARDLLSANHSAVSRSRDQLSANHSAVSRSCDTPDMAGAGGRTQFYTPLQTPHNSNYSNKLSATPVPMVTNTAPPPDVFVTPCDNPTKLQQENWQVTRGGKDDTFSFDEVKTPVAPSEKPQAQFNFMECVEQGGGDAGFSLFGAGDSPGAGGGGGGGGFSFNFGGEEETAGEESSCNALFG